MRKYKWVSMTILTSIFLVSAILTAQAVPPLPSSFYGSAKANGANLPIGTILKAVIDDEVYALAVVELFGGESVYSLDVPGDDSATAAIIEGGLTGDTIQFMLGDTPANETGVWASGTNLRLDLTFNTPTPPVKPSSYYGTVKLNGENVPDNTEIKAVINNITYATSTTVLFGGESVFAINVPGDDPGTPVIVEGGVFGDTVEFFINDYKANETGTWITETNTQFDLTFNQIFPIPGPSDFHGSVKIDNENVPAGTEIKALIGGVEFASSTTTMAAGKSVYEISVPADDPNTPGKEGGVDGDSIQFFIGDLLADQTGTWMNESETRLDLTATEPKDSILFYLPFFTR